mgnify:CR=1 FL=1
MVSLETLKKHNFKTTKQYYEYILKSLVNGQRKQAETLAEGLSTAQKVDAIEYLEDYVSKVAFECKNLILNAI